MSENDAAYAQLAFDLQDLKNEGKLPAKDLDPLLQLLGEGCSPVEMKAIMDELDPSKTGVFTRESFVKWIVARRKKDNINEKTLLEAFGLFSNGGKMITLEQLRLGLMRYNPSLDDSQFNTIKKFCFGEGVLEVDYTMLAQKLTQNINLKVG
jgi:Ca2+-binding EF-hand superfamily protein